MIKTFKTFWTDYGICLKVYGNWLKKHWKGYLVFTGILMGLEGLWFSEKILGMELKKK